MNAPTPAPTPPADPALALRARLLDLSAWLRTARAGADEHRAALAAFETFDNRSVCASALRSLLENVERCIDLLVREVARAGVSLATQAFEDAVKAAPELGGGEVKP